VGIIALADGKVFHNVQDANGKWGKWGDVTAQVGLLGNATEVTTAQTGSELQIGVVADKRAFTSTRHANGTWSGWSEITKPDAGLGPVAGMAFAGTSSEMQTVITTTSGGIKHGIRSNANGSWTAFGDLSGVLGQGTVVSVDAAMVDGELQAAIVTADGKIKHTVRHADRTWDPSDQPVGYPGTPTSVAVTGTWG